LTSREVVIRTIRFEGPDRFAYDFQGKYGSDFARTGMYPSPDARPSKGKDEWGAVWSNLGKSQLGEVKDYPLKDWNDFKKLNIPDITDPERWINLKDAREKAGDKFLLAGGISIYERLHFIRGLEITWVDIYEHEKELCTLIDILVDMNLFVIDKYADSGVDGFFFCDDWGLQNTLMISPEAWRRIWKPRYMKIYRACHNAGLYTFLHSCGYTLEIIDDLIECGLDVFHLDQQENMGLEALGRYKGRLTFFSPVDIQKTMVYGTDCDIREYCRNMVRFLCDEKGGFIPRWYTDPTGSGHRQEAIDLMCEEFLKISKEMYGNY
jgi:hypothetical protein